MYSQLIYPHWLLSIFCLRCQYHAIQSVGSHRGEAGVGQEALLAGAVQHACEVKVTREGRVGSSA